MGGKGEEEEEKGDVRKKMRERGGKRGREGGRGEREAVG